MPASTPDPAAVYAAAIAGVENTPDALEAAVEAHNARASADLKRLTRSVTQGEWLALTRLLDRSRAEIAEDGNLTLLALAYVAEKREHGRASLELLLELTDEQLLAAHGFASPPDDDEQPAEEDTGGGA